MNVHRHEFSKRNTDVLLEFLKVAKEKKSNNSCNLEEYETFKLFSPLEDEMQTNLKEYISNSNEVIDLTLDEILNTTEDGYNESIVKSPINTVSSIPVNETADEDLAYEIKETLDNEKNLSESILNHLHNIDKLEDLFKSLTRELNFEQVSDFGYTLISSKITNDSIIAFYIKYLFLEKINVEFTDKICNIFCQLSLKYPETIVEEISKYLLSFEENYSPILLQLLDKLDAHFKPKVLKAFLLSYPKFQEKYIPLAEILLTNQTDQETICRLIEMISSVANQYSTNKSFGKLLLHIVTCMGRHFQQVEPLLSPIVNSHKSIWKVKIQNTFGNYQQDSQLFTQSFR